VIAAVVVTYNLEPARFLRLLAATGPQVHRIVVVDNGSRPELLEWLRARTASGLILIELGRNAGIAAAQNHGIRRARSLGCSHVLLLDHDSVPAPSMVRQLLAVVEQPPGGRQVAAAGPRYLDERQNNPPPFIRVRGLRVTRCPCVQDGDVVEVDYLIASGSLIPLATLDAVGDMAEDLFIDYVDIEWGLRAAGRGFQSYGVCGAAMEHDLGETPIRFLGRSLPLHSPLRHYYHFRNAVWLYLNADVPLNWKLADGWRLVLKYGFYATFARPRLAHLHMMSRGVLHGLRGRLGSLEEASRSSSPAGPGR
jgi:rhamnosyltransferase